MQNKIKMIVWECICNQSLVYSINKYFWFDIQNNMHYHDTTEDYDMLVNIRLNIKET